MIHPFTTEELLHGYCVGQASLHFCLTHILIQETPTLVKPDIPPVGSHYSF